MKIHFNNWFRSHRMAVDGWSQEKAKSLHENRHFYSTIIGDINSPKCIVEINDSFVLVLFVDREGREKVSFEFEEVKPGKILLKEIQDWEYKDDEKSITTRYVIAQDGKLWARKESVNADNVFFTYESQGELDASKQIIAYPEFGKYDDIVDFCESFDYESLVPKEMSLLKPQLTLYFAASRNISLSESEVEVIDSKVNSALNQKDILEIVAKGNGELFSYEKGSKGTNIILQGSIRLPTSLPESELDDFVYVAETWIELISALRNEIEDTKWEVSLGDEKLKWDSEKREYDIPL